MSVRCCTIDGTLWLMHSMEASELQYPNWLRTSSQRSRREWVLSEGLMAQPPAAGRSPLDEELPSAELFFRLATHPERISRCTQSSSSCRIFVNKIHFCFTCFTMYNAI